MAAVNERPLPSERMQAYRLASEAVRWSGHAIEQLRGLPLELAEVLDDTLLRVFTGLCAAVAAGDPGGFFDALIGVCKAAGLVEVLAGLEALDARTLTAFAHTLVPLRGELKRLYEEAAASEWCPICEALGEDDAGSGPS